MRTLPILAVLMLSLAGCLEPEGGGERPPAIDRQAVEITHLAGGNRGGIETVERAVFHDEASFEAFWLDLHEEPQPVPEVDFAASTVVAATAGQRPDSCWGIRVTNATEAGVLTSVEVTTFSAGPEVACATVVTYPWHVVALAGAGRQIVFSEREIVGAPPATGEPSGPPPTPTDEKPAPTTPASPPAMVALANATVEMGQDSGHRTPARLTFTDRPSWEQFYAKHRPGGTAPAVDFAQRTLVAALLGDMPNACHTVRIEGVQGDPDGSETRVMVTTYRPPPETMCAQAVVQPFHIVSIEGGGRVVQWVERVSDAPPS